MHVPPSSHFPWQHGLFGIPQMDCPRDEKDGAMNGTKSTQITLFLVLYHWCTHHGNLFCSDPPALQFKYRKQLTSHAHYTESHCHNSNPTAPHSSTCTTMRTSRANCVTATLPSSSSSISPACLSNHTHSIGSVVVEKGHPRSAVVPTFWKQKLFSELHIPYTKPQHIPISYHTRRNSPPSPHKTKQLEPSPQSGLIHT